VDINGNEIMEENKIFEIVRVPKSIQELVKKNVVQKLGVENQFKLNDRFEGVYYMNKQLRRILSLYIIGKVFNLELLDYENILKSKSTFIKDEIKYGVVGFDFSENIIIPKLQVDIFLVVGFLDYYNRGKYLGGVKYEDCIELNEKIQASNFVVSKEILSIIKKENLNRITNV